MAQIDYPAAHSMDTHWFAMDDAGEIAYLFSDENGVVPNDAVSQSGLADLIELLVKDEYGTPLLPAISDPFPDGYSIAELQQMFDAYSATEKAKIIQLALHTEREERHKRLEGMRGETIQAVVLLSSPEDLQEFDQFAQFIRIDRDRLIYQVICSTFEILCLLLKERLLAWRELELDEYCNFDFDLTQLHGIYVYNADQFSQREYMNKSIHLAESEPLRYLREAVPAKPRKGLPHTVPIAPELRAKVPQPHLLPGVRFAEMASVQIANLLSAKNFCDDELKFDAGQSIIRRNMAIARQSPSPQRDAHIANWRAAAEHGDPLAQMSLAFAYSIGTGSNDSETAFYWYLQAALHADANPNNSDDMFENGSAAQCCVGDLFENGIGVMQDYQQAASWYLKSAARGNYVAQYRVGMMYKHGKGVVKDEKQAGQWLEKSVLQHYDPTPPHANFD